MHVHWHGCTAASHIWAKHGSFPLHSTTLVYLCALGRAKENASSARSREGATSCGLHVAHCMCVHIPIALDGKRIQGEALNTVGCKSSAFSAPGNVCSGSGCAGLKGRCRGGMGDNRVYSYGTWSKADKGENVVPGLLRVTRRAAPCKRMHTESALISVVESKAGIGQFQMLATVSLALRESTRLPATLLFCSQWDTMVQRKALVPALLPATHCPLQCVVNCSAPHSSREIRYQ